MRAAGFEPEAPDSQVIEDKSRSGIAPDPCAQIGAQISDAGCPDLARVVESWAEMSAPLRQAVLAIVEASQAGRGAK